MTTLDDLIVLGGDERLDLDADGLNKYHLDPRTAADTFHRGSCTCSQLTRCGRRAAHATLERLQNGTIDQLQLAERQRARLLRVVAPGRTARTAVVFAPSGSDLCYVPLLMSHLMRPGATIANVVTTSDELGSGSTLAHEARFFASRTQTGPTPAEERISPDLDVRTTFLPAREPDGSIVDHSAHIERIIRASRPDGPLVVNLVIGSKSGIENGVSIVERFRDEDVMWTVDLCQMRVRPQLVERLLALDCLLLGTGSKFYEAPPFCGAMLIPEQWIDRVAAAPVADVAGFDRIFAAHDVPWEWPELRAAFPTIDNIGLRLRWEAALAEMEPFAAIDDAVTADMMDEWSQLVVDRIDASSTLELLRDDAKTNDSIVSFRISDGRGGHLDHGQLARVHRRIATGSIPEIGPYRRALIGQPVAFGTGSFLRFAIGAPDVRRAVTDGFDPRFDLGLIDAVERIGAEIA